MVGENTNLGGRPRPGPADVRLNAVIQLITSPAGKNAISTTTHARPPAHACPLTSGEDAIPRALSRTGTGSCCAPLPLLFAFNQGFRSCSLL